MKYCISSRQPKSALRQADEIKVPTADFAQLPSLLMEFPDKTIIYHIAKSAEIDWANLLNLGIENHNLIVSLEDLSIRENLGKIPFYWSYPVATWYEFKASRELDPCYIFLAAPLCFDLQRVKEGSHCIPLRMCPNVAYNDSIPRKDGVHGSWIRPEDVEYYEQYIDVLEFSVNALQKERTLLEIYKNDKNWPGNLNFLISRLNTNVNNLGLPENFGQMRLNCRQTCEESGTCHYCDNSIRFSEAVASYKKI